MIIDSYKVTFSLTFLYTLLLSYYLLFTYIVPYFINFLHYNVIYLSKYQVKTISPVEKEYLEALKAISNKIDDKAKSE